ncbi:MAG: hypothetical protein EG824_11710 [Deltaproteobacteria bacterium]|nr:hypothetical protein [Deltaproteobacteria bacterium]
MNSVQGNNITLENLATILGGAFLFNLALLLLWSLAFITAHDWMYGMNTRWFNIGRHEFDLLNYGLIGFLKIINIAFFLFPYLSIKLLLRRKAG